MKKFILIILGVVIILSSLFFVYNSKEVDVKGQVALERPSFETGLVQAINSDGKTIDISVEIAKTSLQKLFGLMNVKELASNQGMWFEFDNEETQSFWMKNTLIPLDMIFVSGNYDVLEIKENVPPCKIEKCAIYASEKPAKYVLEINAGFAKANNIDLNSKISPLIMNE